MNQSTQTGRHTLSSSVPPLFIKWFADITIGDIPLVGQEDRCDGADVLQMEEAVRWPPDRPGQAAEGSREGE